MLTRLVAACALACLSAGPVSAQALYIRAGHVIDPVTGTAADNRAIVVRNGQIVAIGAADLERPRDAQIVDLSRSWVMPGLMDAHTHLTLTIGQPPSLEAVYASQSSALRALVGLRNAQSMLAAGFTTVRDVGNDANYAAVDLKRAIDRGWFQGPTMIVTGKIIAPFGGQLQGTPPEQGRPWQHEYLDADTPEEVRKAVRQNIYYGATAIKLVADNSPYVYTQAEIAAAVDEAHRAGLAVAVHAMTDTAARNAILAGADSIEHGPSLSDELLTLMKEKGTWLVGTEFPLEHALAVGGPGTPMPDPRGEAERFVDRLARAAKIGVRLAFGTDVFTSIGGKSRAAMALDYLDVWHKAGVTPAATLRALTADAAALLRVDKERGTLAPGMAADLIATTENPLEAVTALKRVHFVMKNGTIIRNELPGRVDPRKR